MTLGRNNLKHVFCTCSNADACHKPNRNDTSINLGARLLLTISKNAAAASFLFLRFYLRAHYSSVSSVFMSEIIYLVAVQEC